jgi:hypothetical protein
MKGSFFIPVMGVLFAIMASGAVLAEDRLDLEGNTIFGSRESPKALYVVPWRPLASGDIVGLQVETLLDEELEPIDPEAFRRQVEFFGVLHEKSEKVTR